MGSWRGNENAGGMWALGRGAGNFGGNQPAWGPRASWPSGRRRSLGYTWLHFCPVRPGAGCPGSPNTERRQRRGSHGPLARGGQNWAWAGAPRNSTGEDTGSRQTLLLPPVRYSSGLRDPPGQERRRCSSLGGGAQRAYALSLSVLRTQPPRCLALGCCSPRL